jgi:cyclophilin family peptidyl-prolyl cis-trans isomerase
VGTLVIFLEEFLTCDFIMMYSNYHLQTTILNARGMVGWAGGGSGPDFFINTYLQPVEWWEHQHTVWGQIKDEESLQLVERIYKLPATLKGMRMLDEKIEFQVELF